MKKDLLFSQIRPLQDQAVALHSIGAKDGDQLYRIYSDPQIFRYCGIIGKTNKETVLKMIPHFERDFQKEQRIKWGIFDRKTDTLWGIIEVMDVSTTTNSLTIGYYLHPESWNRGMTKAAVRLLLEYLFGEIEVNRIAAYVMPANHPSKAVLLRNGFSQEGLIREGFLWPGKGIVDLELYGILRRDYEASKNHRTGPGDGQV